MKKDITCVIKVTIVLRRTDLFNNSFVNSTVRAWKIQTETVGNAPSITPFKRLLSNPVTQVQGPQNLQKLHSRLRNKCTSLNAQKYVC